MRTKKSLTAWLGFFVLIKIFIIHLVLIKIFIIFAVSQKQNIMRTYKELLIILKNYTEKLYSFEEVNMCKSLLVLKRNRDITTPEFYKIRFFLRTQKPKEIGRDLWWDKHDKESRINWLNEQLSIL